MEPITRFLRKTALNPSIPSLRSSVAFYAKSSSSRSSSSSSSPSVLDSTDSVVVTDENPETSAAAAAAATEMEGSLRNILKELGKRVPDSLIKTRMEDSVPIKYIPWHIVNRIMNVHAPEWSGEVRNIIYSSDGKTVSVVYRVTIYGVDGEVFRESSGTSSMDDTSYGDPVQKAEAMAYRRACARLGLGLHLYHDDSL